MEHVEGSGSETMTWPWNDGKKQPELFRSNLFSPLSGFRLDWVMSPSAVPFLWLRRALATAASGTGYARLSGTPSGKCALIGTPPCTRVRMQCKLHCMRTRVLRMFVESKLQFHR